MGSKRKLTANDITAAIRAMPPDERRGRAQIACVDIMERFDLSAAEVAGVCATILCGVFRFHGKTFAHAHTALRKAWMESETVGHVIENIKKGEES